MIRAASQIRPSKRFFDSLRSEVPWSVSLAVTGLTVQLYASVMLLRSRNPSVVRIPFLDYKLEDTTSR